MENNVSFTLRLNEEIYENIKKIAEEEKRSLNAEINYILEKYAKEKKEQEKEKK